MGFPHDSTDFFVVASLSSCLLWIVYALYSPGSGKVRLPPGPTALPLLGNVHELPAEYQPRKLAEWGKRYGDVVFAKFFRTPALILNSREAAMEVLDKRGAKYSCRPRFILLAELMGWDSVVNNMPYGERFKKHRKWIQDVFSSREALASYKPIQQRETLTMLAGLVDSPECYMGHVKRWAAAMVMDIAYGHRVTEMDDKYIELVAKTGRETVRAGSPGSMLVDFFPILKGIPLWMPGSGFKRQAFEVRKLIGRSLGEPYDMVRRQMAAGTAGPSFTATLLEECIANGGPTPADEDDIKGAAGVIYAAGTDTTVATMATFILAMTLYPEVYRKAQEEMDRVVGTDRLPEFEDRGSLPYLECLVMEVFRWNAPVPLGVPHRSTADDVLNGHHVPAGSMIIPNIWNMTQDERLYPHPDRFEPERYMGLTSAETERMDARNIVFGFGRRICPGQAFAESNVWLAVASIVATMNISTPADEASPDAPTGDRFISGFVSHPKDFACTISPRAEATGRMIHGAKFVHATA